MHLLSEVAPVPLSSGVEPGRTQERLQQLCHHAMYRYAVLQIACTGVVLHVQTCIAICRLVGRICGEHNKLHAVQRRLHALLLVLL